jgi:integrase
MPVDRGNEFHSQRGFVSGDKLCSGFEGRQISSCLSLRRYSSTFARLASLKKDQVDLQNATVWIPDSKTPNGIAEVPLTFLAIEAFKSRMALSGHGSFLFPSDRNPSGHHGT